MVGEKPLSSALLCSLTLLLFILKQVEDISSIFPFAISEKEELTEITPTRSLKTEQIGVLVSMPKLAQDVKDDEGLLSPSKESQEDEARPLLKNTSLPIRVTVSKADGSGLLFTCTANPDDIVIEGLSIRRKPLGAKEGDAVTYEEGPDFR
jgi:complement component 1 Q subcomponent-binding protein